MKHYNIILFALFFLFSFSCSKNKTKKDIDNYLNKVILSHNIPGMAIAVIKDNKVVYKNHFGKASLEENIDVHENTLFRVFSATKLITSTAVFQLIQENKLKLEDNISKYIDNLPEEWQTVKIKHLLSHSSGLPDLIRYKSDLSDKELFQKLFKDKMNFDLGNQFQYNQTNYWLLSLIIEKITNNKFDNYVLKKQFDNSSGVLFSSNSKENIKNRSARYLYDFKNEKHKPSSQNDGQRGHPGNGLNITLDKFIEWNKLLDNNELLRNEFKLKMWEPFEFKNKKDIFLHGWNSYNVNNKKSVGFSGGNLAAFRKFPENNTTIILLSNGYKIPAFDIIINDIARITTPDFEIKKLVLEEDVMQHVFNKEYKKAIAAYKKLRTENQNSKFDNLRWNINSIANSLTFENKKAEALKVFNINAKANPDWWVSFASLAESYETLGEYAKAIHNYAKAIKMNPNNELNYNTEMQKKITQLNNKN